MECPKCNVEVAEDQDFCEKCGHQLKEDAQRKRPRKRLTSASQVSMIDWRQCRMGNFAPERATTTKSFLDAHAPSSSIHLAMLFTLIERSRLT